MKLSAWLVRFGTAVACCTGGCALFSKSAPITPQYFSPERPDDVVPSPAERPDLLAELRLGRVVSVGNLEEMLVFRDSASELGYFRLRRWTEAPEQYVRRRLARVLFEERGLREVMGGGGPTLDVQLTAFEEVLSPTRRARVQMVVRLHDERLVRWEETITVEEPVIVAVAGDPAVAAIGTALRAAVVLIADRVVRELEVSPSARMAR